MMEHFNSNHFFYNSFCLASKPFFKIINFSNPYIISFYREGDIYETLHINRIFEDTFNIELHFLQNFN